MTIEFVVCAPSTDKLLPWVYPKVDCRPAFVDSLCSLLLFGQSHSRQSQRGTDTWRNGEGMHSRPHDSWLPVPWKTTGYGLQSRVQWASKGHGGLAQGSLLRGFLSLGIYRETREILWSQTRPKGSRRLSEQNTRGMCARDLWTECARSTENPWSALSRVFQKNGRASSVARWLLSGERWASCGHCSELQLGEFAFVTLYKSEAMAASLSSTTFFFCRRRARPVKAPV